jgi:hypothetical protein
MLKYYVILDNTAGTRFTFPIKAVLNQFDGTTQQFAGGYPAFFGGTAAAGASNLQTVQAETTQESRSTLAVNGDATLQEIIHSQINGDDLTFSWTANWRETGVAWGPPVSFATGEMSGVVTLSYGSFSGHTGSPKEVLDRLISLSGAPGGSAKQKADFFASETAAAFVQQILNSVTPPSLRS